MFHNPNEEKMEKIIFAPLKALSLLFSIALMFAFSPCDVGAEMPDVIVRNQAMSNDNWAMVVVGFE